MNEVVNSLKRYPELVLGFFIIYSISYNKSDSFFFNTAIDFCIIYYISYKLIKRFAFWACFRIDMDEKNVGEILFSLTMLIIMGWCCFIFYKILLSQIWDTILSASTYAAKIKFILSDDKLCLLAILILLFRLLWFSDDKVERFIKRRRQNTK